MMDPFPAFLSPLLDRLNGEATPALANIGGIDVLLYATCGQGAGLVGKALCIAPPIPSSTRDALIDGVNHLRSPCVECLVVAGLNSLQIQDLVCLRSVTVCGEELDAQKIDCICQYVNAGHVVFLDPVFEDPEFLKQCWAAFSNSIHILGNAGLQDRDQCVRAALQVAIELCIVSWRAQTAALKAPVSLGINLQSIDGTSLAAIDAAWRSIPDLEARLDERIVCHLMEQSILGKEKKQTGSYYTPRAWAWYTCHEALLAYGASIDRDAHMGHLTELDLQQMNVLDPAMGSGDFLDAMSLTLVDAWLSLLAGFQSDAQIDWNALRFHAKLEHVFKHNLHGIDLNKLAVDVTRARFVLNAIKHVSKDPSLGKVMESFTIDLAHDDFLTRNVGLQAYDIVIGNPPYLMEVRNNQTLFRHYSKHPGTRDRYEPKMDLFYFFMFKGIEVLKDRGVMGFVVQEYWLDRFHARQLRQFMFQEAAIVDMVLFKRCKVFPTAPGQHTMILVARKGKATPDDEARIMIVKDSGSAGMTLLGEVLAGAGTHVGVHHTRNRSMYDANKDQVFVSGDAEQGFFERVHAMEHHTIHEAEIQVGINIPQPFVRKGGKVEGVFVVPRDQAPRIATTPEEQSILRPFHKATDISAYGFSTREGYFIIYTTNESMKRVENEHDAFARIRSHLDRYVGVITSDHKPYGLHRPRQREWFEARDKIIGVRKTRSPRFAVVPQDYYMDQAALFVQLDPAKGISPYYACAFLNSPVASKIFSGIKTQGGQLQIDKNVLARLPVPACHPVDQKVVSTLSAWLHALCILGKAGTEPAGDALQTRIRGIIDRFFGRLASHGGKDQLLTGDNTDSIPQVELVEHLVKQRCIDGLEHLESTVIDIEDLRTFVSPLLPSLERAIDRLVSRDGC